MDKYYSNLIINEVRNFNKLQKQWGYADVNDLIAHYIEEGIISSKDELVKILSILKTKLSIAIKTEIFNDWWIDKKVT